MTTPVCGSTSSPPPGPAGRRSLRLLGGRLADELVLEVARVELGGGRVLVHADEQRHGHRLARRELVLDLVVDVPAADQRGERAGSRPGSTARSAGAAAPPRSRSRRAAGYAGGAFATVGAPAIIVGIALTPARICVAVSSVSRLTASPRATALEVGVHLLGALVAPRRVLRQRAHHDLVEFLGHVRVQLRRRRRRVGEVLHRDLDRRLARERHLPGQQLVEDDADASRGRSAGRPARRAPARARGTAPCRRSSRPRSSGSRRRARCRSPSP